MVGIGFPRIIVGLLCCLGVVATGVVVCLILLARCSERSWPSTRRSAERKNAEE